MLVRLLDKKQITESQASLLDFARHHLTSNKPVWLNVEEESFEIKTLELSEQYTGLAIAELADGSTLALDIARLSSVGVGAYPKKHSMKPPTRL